MAVRLFPDEGSEFESDIIKGLNPEQKKAVTQIDGPLLVVAGAGSGKTRVLTNRIAYLIENNIRPYNILALTFTNKAATEMKERIGNLVSVEAARQIWAGTFHSIFARMLRAEADKLGYTSSYTIYDAEDSLSAIKKILKKLKLSQKDYAPQGIRSAISSSKNRMISWQEYSRSANDPIEKVNAQVFQEYEKYLHQNNAMDFDDLLINVINVLKTSEEALKKYQNRFKYILVDEYQDTNRAQYIVLNLLAKAHQNICVVGDDAQSIYRWRGAEIKNILEFQKYFPETKVVRLEQNYRSTKTILAAADSVIKKNSNQIPKTLWTDNQQGEKIELLRAMDERNEADTIVKKIKELLSKDFDPKDIAILYRTNAQSQALENSLRKFRTPYVIVGGISFYKRKEVKDTMSYLKLLVNPRDTESLERVINEPPRGLGAKSMDSLKKYASMRGMPLFDVLALADDIAELKPRAKNSAKEFYGMVKTFIDKKGSEQPAKLVNKYIDQTGMLQMYKEIKTEDSLDRWNNIQQMLSDISSYFRRQAKLQEENYQKSLTNSEESFTQAGTSLEDYLQQLALVADIDNADTSQNQTKLMTIHSAKGLEFPIVFVAGTEDGLFPLTRPDSPIEELEEERRLFYVAITRAEEKLYISYSTRRMRFGEVKTQQPSKFLKEISSEFIKNGGGGINIGSREPKAQTPRARNVSAKSTPKYGKFGKRPGDNYSQLPAQEDYSQTSNLLVGDIVMHSQFGKGRIEGLAGAGQKRQALVNFARFGRKKLMLVFAKLEKIS